MNQWQNESCSSSSVVHGTTMVMEDKNKSIPCPNITVKQEVIDAHDIGWRNPNGILNATSINSASTTATNTKGIIISSSSMNGMRNGGIGAVGISRRRVTVNEKSLVQLEEISGGEKSPFVFQTCTMATTTTTSPTTSQPGALSSSSSCNSNNDGPFHSNWHPSPLESSSSTTSTTSLHRRNNHHEVLAQNNSISSSYRPPSSTSSIIGNGGGGRGNINGINGGGVGQKLFGSSGSGANEDNRFRSAAMVAVKRENYNSVSASNPRGNSSGSNNGMPMMMTSINSLGHHHQGSLVNTSTSTNSNTTAYFSHGPSHPLNGCNQVNRRDVDGENNTMKTTTPHHHHHHYHQFREDHQHQQQQQEQQHQHVLQEQHQQSQSQNNYFDMNQRRKQRALRSHSVIKNYVG